MGVFIIKYCDVFSQFTKDDPVPLIYGVQEKLRVIYL